MSKNNKDIFNNKVSLIYEYDKKSPLFARMANTEIENNNVDRAIEILNYGLKIYPQYAVAYFILGRALTLIGEYGKALRSIKTGADLVQSPKTYEYYLREIESIKKQRSLFATTRRSAFLSDNFSEFENQPELFDLDIS